jgi:hypothetical protein
LPYERPREECTPAALRPDASQIRRVGTIKMFYHFRIDGQETTFVDILCHPTAPTKRRGLYCLNTVEPFPLGLDRYPVTTGSTLYHLDAITNKIMLVKHYSPALASTKMCGIVM